MTERVLTDEELARQNIFGIPPKPSDEPDVPDTPDVPDIPDAPDAPDVPDAPPDNPDMPDTPGVPDTPAFDINNIKEEQLLELMNKKFNVNFETMDAASGYFSSQAKLRGQEDIITKLAEELKNKSNVLSHFPSENAYKVAQLAKTDYPGKEDILSRVMNSDVKALSDLDAIRLNESLKRPSDSRVDPLRFKCRNLG